MKQYLIAILSFTAVVVGVFGHSGDARYQITGLGWIAIAVGAATLLTSIVGTYKDHRRLDWQASQREKVRIAAKMELRRALMQLISPFEILCENVASKFKALRLDSCRFHVDIQYMKEKLLDPDFRAGWESIDLRKHPDAPGTFPSYTWWDYFSHMAVRADAKLDATVAKYGAYLDTSELLLIHALQSDPFFFMRLKELKILVDANERAPTYPVAWAFLGPDDGDAYIQFINKVCNLAQILPEPAHGNRGDVKS